MYPWLHGTQNVWRQQTDDHCCTHCPCNAIFNTLQPAEDIIDVITTLANTDQQGFNLAFEAAEFVVNVPMRDIISASHGEIDLALTG
jgi:hypothetical protein